MSFEDDFLSCMTDNIVVTSRTTAIGAYGQTNLSSTTTTYKGIFQQTQRMVRSADGNEVLSSANVIMDSTKAFNLTDKFTLPDGTIRPVLSIRTYYDQDGGHHTTVDFG